MDVRLRSRRRAGERLGKHEHRSPQERSSWAPVVGARRFAAGSVCPCVARTYPYYTGLGVTRMAKEVGQRRTTTTTVSDRPVEQPQLLLPSDPGFAEIEERAEERSGLSRRSLLRLGALGVAGVTLAGGRQLAD